MRLNHVKQLCKRGFSAILSGAMTVTLFASVPALSAEISGTAGSRPEIFKAGSVPVKEDTITFDEPFAQGTAGSDRFRIPCLITLENGELLSVADARWTTVKDGGGLDTLASVSSDEGKTWNFSFPLYFPDSDGFVGNDATNLSNSKATTIIDPGIVEGPDGTIYCFVDVNPTNCTTLFKNPMGTGTGYVTVNGGRYLALTDDYANVDTEPTDQESSLDVYPYYVDNFDDEGYARIRRRDNGDELDYVVDRWYNIYSVDEQGEYRDDLTQKQIVNNNGGTNDVDIQQNCFYENSIFHVYRIGYIWMITSKDHGRTWEAPIDINDQVKRRQGERAILVSPGRGMTTSNGTIVMGFYNSHDGEENASMIWSDDNGKTWKRSNDVPGAANGGFQTSENEIIELSDGTLRMFLRNQKLKICYADAVRNEEGEYEFSAPVQTDFSVSSDCNLSAITYSKKIDGKQAVLLSCPGTDRRKDGKIFTFLIDGDKRHSLDLVHTFSIPARTSDTSFAYSCLTELTDGSVAVLWEVNSAVYMYFDKFAIDELMPEQYIEGVSVDVDLVRGETYTRNYSRKDLPGIMQDADGDIAEVSVSENGISIQALADRGYTEAVVDHVKYKINVIDNSVVLSVGERFEIANAGTAYESILGDAVTVESVNNGNTALLFGHSSNINHSINAFQAEPESDKTLSEAEFTFTSVGDKWQVYNEHAKVYLANHGAVQYFDSSSANLNISKHTNSDTFKITNETGRVVLFYAGGGMVFDAAVSYNASEDLDDKLTLLKKQDTVSAEDIIPGYKVADSIVTGGRYLISYIYNGNVIVLYPENGRAEQTKLVKTQKTNKTTITAQKTGVSSVAIDGKIYNFKVADGNCRHTETVRKGAVAAGCFTEGYTGELYCANPDCGICLKKEGDVVSALGGHDWDEGKIAREVTETENGELVYTCRNDAFHTRTEVIYSSAYAAMQGEHRAVSEIRNKLYGMYTQKTIKELERVYEEQKAVLESKRAGYHLMCRAVEELQAARAALKMKTVDTLKGELQAACQKAEPDYRANETNLGEAWTAFLNAYNAAVSSKDAGAEELWRMIRELDTARDALLTARAEFLLQNAKNTLQSALSSAKGEYDAGQRDYTAATWNAFAAAYQAALNAPINADADTLNTLLKNLLAAQKALAKDSAKTEKEFKKGTRVSGAAGVYEVTSVSKREVTLTKGKDKANVKIPLNIIVNGISCKVVAIGKGAFQNAKKVKKVSIGDHVKSIGVQAFSGCKRLNSISLGANVKTIGKKAFMNCKKLKTVTLKGASAPSIGKQSFKGTASKVTVKASKIKKSQRKKLLSKMKSAGKMSKNSVIK